VKNPPEPLSTPPLANTREAAVVGKLLIKPIPGKPTYRQVDLNLAHEFTVMNDALEKSSQHKPYRSLRVDAGPSVR
jgi:hypothetical protein